MRWGPGDYQVGLTIGSSEKISEHIAKAVSLKLGGNGDVSIIDSCDTYDLWMVNLPGPYDGEIDVVGDNGDQVIKVKVETPLP